MTRKEVEIYAVEHGLELPVLTDGDDAIVGVVCEGGVPRVVYSKGRFIASLQVGGMTEEEALEWFDYNTAPLPAVHGRKPSGLCGAVK